MVSEKALKVLNCFTKYFVKEEYQDEFYDKSLKKLKNFAEQNNVDEDDVVFSIYGGFNADGANLVEMPRMKLKKKN